MQSTTGHKVLMAEKDQVEHTIATSNPPTLIEMTVSALEKHKEREREASHLTTARLGKTPAK